MRRQRRIQRDKWVTNLGKGIPSDIEDRLWAVIMGLNTLNH